MSPDFAVIVVEPEAVIDWPVARPVLAIVATDVSEDCHVTCLVTSTVLPDARTPIAVYCCVPPAVIDEFVGSIEIDLRSATETVKLVDPERRLAVALMVVLPGATPVTSPVSSTVAMVESDVVQLEPSVMFFFDPSS
jgi:hypothetical protein